MFDVIVDIDITLILIEERERLRGMLSHVGSFFPVLVLQVIITPSNSTDICTRTSCLSASASGTDVVHLMYYVPVR